MAPSSVLALEVGGFVIYGRGVKRPGKGRDFDVRWWWGRHCGELQTAMQRRFCGDPMNQ